MNHRRTLSGLLAVLFVLMSAVACSESKQNTDSPQ
jgi:hypothetical protein